MHFPKQALVFTCPGYKSSENTVGKKKGEIAHNEQFLLFPQRFLPFNPLPHMAILGCSILAANKDMT